MKGFEKMTDFSVNCPHCERIIFLDSNHKGTCPCGMNVIFARSLEEKGMEYIRHIFNGQKIHAIKCLKDSSGMSLKYAKEFTDGVLKGVETYKKR